MPLRSDTRRNRAAIVQTALSVLAEDPRASLQEIARAAGVNRSTVHRHFARREDLMAAVAREAVRQIDEVHREGRAEGGTTAEQLERILRRNILRGDHLRFFWEHLDEILERGDASESAASWAALVADAKADGVIRADLPDEWIERFTGATVLLAIRMAAEGVVTIEEAADLGPAAVLAAL